MKFFVVVYNPPEHIQQATIFNNAASTSTSPAYTWSSPYPVHTQTTASSMSPALNCWSDSSSPQRPHHISPPSTPNQSPTHEMYQPSPVTTLTNISYTNYYTQDFSGYGHYQPPEYMPLMNLESSYPSHVTADRQTFTMYQAETIPVPEKFEETSPVQGHSPESNSSTPRHHWIA